MRIHPAARSLGVFQAQVGGGASLIGAAFDTRCVAVSGYGLDPDLAEALDGSPGAIGSAVTVQPQLDTLELEALIGAQAAHIAPWVI